MSILSLLLAGAVVSTVIKVGLVVVGTKVYRARRRQREAQAPTDPITIPPTAPSTDEDIR